MSTNITPNSSNNVTVLTNTVSVTTTTDNSKVVTIVTPGPQGPSGSQGPQGPAGVAATGSLVSTASFSNPNIQFTKGDGSTFNVDLTSLSEWYDGSTFITSSKDVIISGSLTVSGSNTFTNIGPAVFEGNITSSGTVSASFFVGDGSDLTNLQRPISASVQTNLTASNTNSGFFFEVGGLVTCSIQTVASVACDVGNEYEFFQTGSGNFLFETASGVTMYSKSGLKLNGEFAACTLKHIKTNTWVLIGDMTT